MFSPEARPNPIELRLVELNAIEQAKEIHAQIKDLVPSEEVQTPLMQYVWGTALVKTIWAKALFFDVYPQTKEGVAPRGLEPLSLFKNFYNSTVIEAYERLDEEMRFPLILESGLSGTTGNLLYYTNGAPEIPDASYQDEILGLLMSWTKNKPFINGIFKNERELLLNPNFRKHHKPGVHYASDEHREFPRNGKVVEKNSFSEEEIKKIEEEYEISLIDKGFDTPKQHKAMWDALNPAQKSKWMLSAIRDDHKPIFTEEEMEIILRNAGISEEENQLRIVGWRRFVRNQMDAKYGPKATPLDEINF